MFSQQNLAEREAIMNGYDYSNIARKKIDKYIDDSKDIKSFLFFPENIKIIKDLKLAKKEMSKFNALLYCFSNVFHIGYLWVVISSLKKQCIYINIVQSSLKKVPVQPKDIEFFKYFIKKLSERLKYVNVIIDNILKDSEYCEFFQKIKDGELSYLLEDYNNIPYYTDLQRADFIHTIEEAWNDYKYNNKEEYENCKRKASEKALKLTKRKASIHEENLIRKQIEKNLKKAEDAEVKEIQKNAAKEKDKNNKINQEMKIGNFYLLKTNNGFLGKGSQIKSYFFVDDKFFAKKFVKESTAVKFKNLLIQNGINCEIMSV